LKLHAEFACFAWSSSHKNHGLPRIIADENFGLRVWWKNEGQDPEVMLATSNFLSSNATNAQKTFHESSTVAHPETRING